MPETRRLRRQLWIWLAVQPLLLIGVAWRMQASFDGKVHDLEDVDHAACVRNQHGRHVVRTIIATDPDTSPEEWALVESNLPEISCEGEP